MAAMKKKTGTADAMEREVKQRRQKNSDALTGKKRISSSSRMTNNGARIVERRTVSQEPYYTSPNLPGRAGNNMAGGSVVRTKTSDAIVKPRIAKVPAKKKRPTPKK